MSSFCRKCIINLQTEALLGTWGTLRCAANTCPHGSLRTYLLVRDVYASRQIPHVQLPMLFNEKRRFGAAVSSCAINMRGT